MPEVAVLDTRGHEVDRLTLAEEVFGVEVRPDLMHRAVVAQLANQRAGTASTKTRGEVRGGGVKPWRQKGTGRARHGSRRSPLWAGGGVIHGPKPRSFRQKLPRKVRQWALRSAWTDKVQRGAFIVVEDLADLPEQKTRAASEALSSWTEAEKVLLMLVEEEQEAGRLFRNLPGVNIYRAPYASVYDLACHDVVVATRRAVQRIEEELVR